jgi:hypothetical protein
MNVALATAFAAGISACGGAPAEAPPPTPAAGPPPPAVPSGWQEVRGGGWRGIVPDGAAKKQASGWTARRGHVLYEIDEGAATTDVPENALASAAAGLFDSCNGKVVRAYRDDVPGRSTLVVDGTCSGAQALAQVNLRAGHLVELVAIVQGPTDPGDQDDMRSFFRSFRFDR